MFESVAEIQVPRESRTSSNIELGISGIESKISFLAQPMIAYPTTLLMNRIPTFSPPEPIFVC